MIYEKNPGDEEDRIRVFKVQKALGFSEIPILADSGPVLQFPASLELIGEINVHETDESSV